MTMSVCPRGIACATWQCPSVRMTVHRLHTEMVVRQCACACVYEDLPPGWTAGHRHCTGVALTDRVRHACASSGHPEAWTELDSPDRDRHIRHCVPDAHGNAALPAIWTACHTQSTWTAAHRCVSGWCAAAADPPTWSWLHTGCTHAERDQNELSHACTSYWSAQKLCCRNGKDKAALPCEISCAPWGL